MRLFPAIGLLDSHIDAKGCQAVLQQGRCTHKGVLDFTVVPSCIVTRNTSTDGQEKKNTVFP